jgi:hypothetical protein
MEDGPSETEASSSFLPRKSDASKRPKAGNRRDPFVAIWHETCVDLRGGVIMPKSATGQPKYLMCARALALLSGLAAGAAGCESSLVPENSPKDAANQTYDGGFFGVRINTDAQPTPYDGGVVGSRVSPDAHPTAYDGGVVGLRINPDAHPTPYDGGVVGVRINPDANIHLDAHTSPYDGGFLGVRINPDAL